MRYRLLFLAVLAVLSGVALAPLAPAQPATADDSCSAGFDCVDCSKVVVFDPSFCMYPPEPPPPPRSASSMGGMGPGAPVPPSPQPGMMPDLPGEVCDRTRTFSDRAGIIETGQPNKLVYTFIVTTTFCTQNGIVTKARITADTNIVQPLDDRISSIGEVITEPVGVTGRPTFFQAENVITEFCLNGPSDPNNCKLFRHVIGISIDARSSNPLTVVPDLFQCTNPACT